MLETLTLAILVGVVVGTLTGALGGGGGIVALPALVYLLDQEPHQAATTSLIVVTVTSLVGITQHDRLGSVSYRDGVAFGILTVGGAVAGARLSALLDGDVMLALLALLLLVVGVLMWRKSRGKGRPSVEHPTPWITWRPVRIQWSRAVPIVLAATGVGMLTGLFGIGGGFAIVPALVLLLQLPIRRAVGTSLVVMAMTGGIALVTRLASSADVDWPLVVTFAATAAVSGVAATRLAHRVDAVRLQQAFAILLLCVSAYTAFQAISALA